MHLDPEKLWEATLGQLQVKLARPTFDTFLRETKAIGFAGNLLSVWVPNSFTADYLEKRLSSPIKSVLNQISGQQLNIRFEQGSIDNPYHQKHSPDAPKFSRAQKNLKKSLYGRHTFKTFVVGASNKLAYTVAFSAADASSTKYNPVYLYSDPGLGKTHLLISILREAELSGQNAKYITSERFTHEFVSSIKAGKVNLFRESYQALDLLLIDDFQLFSGKDQTQEGFFHVFNDLHQNNSQIVVAADRPTKAMAFLSRRLRSRLDWGISIKIVPPDNETRLRILQSKCLTAGVSIPEDVLRMIAQNPFSSVRELEGTLNRVVAYSEATGMEYSQNLIFSALTDLTSTDSQDPPSSSLVLRMIAQDYGIPVSNLESPRRDRLSSEARHVAMYLLRTQSRQTTGEIGRLLGGRDHSTVNSGCTRVEKQLLADPLFHRRLLSLRSQIEALP